MGCPYCNNHAQFHPYKNVASCGNVSVLHYNNKEPGLPENLVKAFSCTFVALLPARDATSRGCDQFACTQLTEYLREILRRAWLPFLEESHENYCFILFPLTPRAAQWTVFGPGADVLVVPITSRGIPSTSVNGAKCRSRYRTLCRNRLFCSDKTFILKN